MADDIENPTVSFAMLRRRQDTLRSWRCWRGLRDNTLD